MSQRVKNLVFQLNPEAKQQIPPRQLFPTESEILSTLHEIQSEKLEKNFYSGLVPFRMLDPETKLCIVDELKKQGIDLENLKSIFPEFDL